MADQGLIAGPNGQTGGAYYAIKFTGLWQNNGMLPYVAKPNAMQAGLYFAVSWEGWLAASLPLQRTQNRSGYITGVVTNDAVIVPHARVMLFNGVGLLLNGTLTNVAGVYRFNGLNKTYSDYTVLVSDPSGVFNLGRLDNMTPF